MRQKKKVRINLKDLKVKSFITTPAIARDAGTVRGMCEGTENGPYGDQLRLLHELHGLRWC
jgi:hypothetical protein